ncbi:hypothetical protein [Marinoscillum sp. MHG1-6]|uniref:hypothetical protein n=1 Tax=Marinoscillum sp. MHG1-6 TaxID=2959627 RepID=UPI0021570AE6|nr:hypothetical protein [Marinoscillum sp. MHG1-6]
MQVVRLLVCLVMLLGLSTVSAQKFSMETWHRGFLVSVERDTIRGKIKYDIPNNVVLVSRNEVVQTFTSQKTFYFEIFDEIVGNYRQFYALPYNVNFDYELPIFFEVLYEGPLSLLTREAIVTEVVNASGAYYSMPVQREVVSYAYFFLDKKGNIRRFSGNKKDLYLIMSNKQAQVKSFVKKNRLNTNDLRDLIRITAFYNSL